MGIWHQRSRRSATGSLYKKFAKKRKHALGREPTETLLGEKKIKKIRTKGGGLKVRLVRTMEINVVDPKTHKIFKAKILSVEKNPANTDYSRRGVITKSTLVRIEKGLVRVTSRPGQDGVLNGVLIEES